MVAEDKHKEDAEAKQLEKNLQVRVHVDYSFHIDFHTCLQAPSRPLPCPTSRRGLRPRLLRPTNYKVSCSVFTTISVPLVKLLSTESARDRHRLKGNLEIRP